MDIRKTGGIAAAAVTLALALASSGAQAGQLFLPFVPFVAAGPGLSPERCYVDVATAISGSLGGPEPTGSQGECHSTAISTGAYLGHPVGTLTGARASFTSPPFVRGLELAGPASIKLYYVDLPSMPLLGNRNLSCYLYEFRGGEAILLADLQGSVEVHGNVDPSGGVVVTFDVGRRSLAPGSHLYLTFFAEEGGRLLYGGVPVASSMTADNLVLPETYYGDAGMTLELAEGIGKSGVLGGGALSLWPLLVMLLGVGVRHADPRLPLGRMAARRRRR